MTRTAVVLLLLLPLAGCLATHNGRPEHAGARIEARGPRDLARPVRWRQILFGAGKSEQRVGYLRSEPIGEGTDPPLLHQVYDLNMELVGRISPNGITYRMDPFGREQHLGSFTVEHALLTIWTRTEEAEVRLLPMPQPL